MPQGGRRPPFLLIISGPSGGGKGTIISSVVQNIAGFTKVVNYTTRDRRPGEAEGIDYHFVDEDEFMRKFDCGEIFEYERVYDDYYYGSPSDVFEGLTQDRIIELDYKGHTKYRKRYPDQVVSIFLLPPSLEELRRRIIRRSPEENLSARLENAREQLRHAKEYDYMILNDDLANCREQVFTTIEAERIRRRGWTLLRDLGVD